VHQALGKEHQALGKEHQACFTFLGTFIDLNEPTSYKTCLHLIKTLFVLFAS